MLERKGERRDIKCGAASLDVLRERQILSRSPNLSSRSVPARLSSRETSPISILNFNYRALGALSLSYITPLHSMDEGTAKETADQVASSSPAEILEIDSQVSDTTKIFSHTGLPALFKESVS